MAVIYIIIFHIGCTSFSVVLDVSRVGSNDIICLLLYYGEFSWVEFYPMGRRGSTMGSSEDQRSEKEGISEFKVESPCSVHLTH